MFTYDKRAEYGIFAWVSIHHIVQMLLALIVIVIAAKLLKLDFGFGVGDRKIGMKHVADFTVIALVFAVVWHVVAHLQGTVRMPNYPLNFFNIAGEFGFQLLLSGPSEEILFRALPITLLLYSFRESREIRIHKMNISHENIIAALLFALAHIGWSLNPLSVSASWFQVGLSFVCGIFYGVAYKESKSIIYPMAMHSIWNVIMVAARYIHLAILA